MKPERKPANPHVMEGVFGFVAHPLFYELRDAGITIEGIQNIYVRRGSSPGERLALTVSGKHCNGSLVEKLDEIKSKLDETPFPGDRTLRVSIIKQFGETDLAKQRFRRKLSLLGFGLDRELPEGWHVIEVLHAEKQPSVEEAMKARRSLLSIAGSNTAPKAAAIKELLTLQKSHIQERQAQAANLASQAKTQAEEKLMTARKQLGQEMTGFLARKAKNP